VSNVYSDHTELEELCQVFRLLSDPTRLRILSILRAGERHVSSLCDILQLPQPTVSHHLSLLRMAGVASGRRAGKQVYYRLNPDMVNLEPSTRAIRMRKGSARISLGEPQDHAAAASGAAVSSPPAGIAEAGTQNGALA
jgi:DNA-binding transcriptional ArsR family regulator